jgi:hypothetical protein
LCMLGNYAGMYFSNTQIFSDIKRYTVAAINADLVILMTQFWEKHIFTH